VTSQNSSSALRLELTTDSQPQAVRQARRAIESIDELRSDAQLVFNVRLLVSELVTNAVTHGFRHQQEHQITMVAQLHDNRLRVEVSDGGPGFILGQEKPEAGTPEQTSGRGLQLLRSLADRYGNGDRTHGGQVWFEIDLPEPATDRP
jgi:anti-sigma regulatory factor (Ser/Thr protein kinase)